MHANYLSRLCSAAIAAVLACLPAPAEPEGGARSFSAELMLGGRVRPDGFTPILLSLSTTGPFRGRIRVAVKGESSVSCRIPLNVGKGDFRFAVPAPVCRQDYYNVPLALEAILQDDRGRVLARRELDLVPVNLDSPDVILPRLGVMIGKNAAALPGVGGGGFAIAPAANLPEDPLLYDAVDFVMAPSGAAAGMSGAQAEALVKWVRSGGTLVVDSSANDRELARNPLLERLGIELEPGRTDVAVSLPPPVLARHRYGMQMPVPGAATNAGAVSVPVSLRAIRCGEARAAGTNALRADVAAGSGRLILTSLDLENLARNGDYGASALLYEIVIGNALADQNPGLETSPAFNKYSLRMRFPAWRESLFEMAGLEEIPVWFVMGFLVVFVLAVSPLTRWALGRAGLPRLSWAVKAAIVLLFCFAGGLLSHAMRGTEPLRSVLCVHQYGPAGGGRHVWLDCFIPASARAVNAQPFPGGMVCDLSSFTPGSGAVCDGALRDVEFTSPVWGAHFLYSTALHGEQAPFEAAISNVNGRGTWFLTCRRPEIDVRDVRIIWREREFRTRPVAGGWLAVGSGVVDMVASDENAVFPEGRDALMRALAQLETRHAFSEAASFAFRPAPIHGWARPGEWGVILAECGRGLESRMDVATPRKTALHAIRQVVRSPGMSPGMIPPAAEPGAEQHSLVPPVPPENAVQRTGDKE